MIADAADGQPEDQRAAGLPAEVDPPAHPQRAAAQVSRGEHQAQHHRDGNAGVVRSGQKRLHNGIKGRKAERRSQRTHRAFKSLKPVAAKGNFFSQRGQREECSVGHEPSPGRRPQNQHNGDATAHDHR